MIKYSSETKLKTAKLKETHLHGIGFQVDTALGCANIATLSESLVTTDLPIFKLNSRFVCCPHDRAYDRVSVSWNFCEIVMELLN